MTWIWINWSVSNNNAGFCYQPTISEPADYLAHLLWQRFENFCPGTSDKDSSFFFFFLKTATAKKILMRQSEQALKDVYS